MRINQYLAAATELSRRAADDAIIGGRVTVDGQPATVGQSVEAGQSVSLDGRTLKLPGSLTVIFNKPVGVVCSKRQQGSAATIYQALPEEFSNLNYIGRLDKATSGLVVLTNDGQLHQRLGHPSAGKLKVYELVLDRPLSAADAARLEAGVQLADGPSRLQIRQQAGNRLTVALAEGRNRQIRRTIDALGYKLFTLHRTQVGELKLGNLKPGHWRVVKTGEDS